MLWKQSRRQPKLTSRTTLRDVTATSTWTKPDTRCDIPKIFSVFLLDCVCNDGNAFLYIVLER